MRKENQFSPFQMALFFQQFASSQSVGRRSTIENSDDDGIYLGALNPFFIDKEKIRLSKSLRRLNDKTQVFVDRQNNPHLRNRRTHTDEVVSVAVYIATILGLNVHLVEAIALGHDIGHTPYGHIGERAISELAGRKFTHQVMSLVIAQKVERSGKGLNLSWETLEGILNHSRGDGQLIMNRSLPLEYAVVMFADKIAYTFSDLNDALRCSYFQESQLPAEFFALGKSQRERTNNCILHLVKESAEKQFISFSDSQVAQQFESLRQWSFHNFYRKLDHEVQREAVYDDFKKVYPFLEDIFGKLGHNVFLALALMTDSEIRKITLTLKKDKKKIYAPGFFSSFGFYEILSNLPKNSKIDIFNADLDKSKFKRFDAW
ncbi:MAG: HD domain-containing protein [Patescibacteria group bacterium]